MGRSHHRGPATHTIVWQKYRRIIIFFTFFVVFVVVVFMVLRGRRRQQSAAAVTLEKTSTSWLSRPFAEIDLEKGITFVTHLSIDRIENLVDIMSVWKGPISVAIFVPQSKTQSEARTKLWPELRDGAIAVRNCRSKVVKCSEEELQKALDIAASSSLSAKAQKRVSAETDASIGAEVRYFFVESPFYRYPVNILRNNAIRLARTNLVFHADADFVPSAGLFAYLQQELDKILSQTSASNGHPPRAFVVPCFQQESMDSGFARDQAELRGKIEQKLVRPMFEGEDIYPHIYSTQYDKWYTAKEPYPAIYHDVFEPYVVVDKTLIPAFDERFVYWGNDKIQQVKHMHMLGFEFWVLPYHFIIHKKHPKSEWFQADYEPGTRDKVQHMLAMQNNELQQQKQSK